MLACLSGWYGAEEHLSVPLALRQRKLQTKIQKEGRCEEDQPSRAHRKLRVHRKRINRRYAARERCASIPTSTPSISRRASRTRSASCLRTTLHWLRELLTGRELAMGHTPTNIFDS